jgi:hypothetical protein
MDDASQMASNVPEVLRAKSNGACILADRSAFKKDFVQVQVRNSCPKSGSGFIGNYYVDLRSGRIWRDVDQQHEVVSKHLVRLRAKLREKH